MKSTATITETTPLRLTKDIMRRIIIYSNLFLTFYVGKNESESDRLIGNMFFNTLSIGGIVLSLIHYRFLYKITDLHYCHETGTLTVYHGGQITSVLVVLVNFLKIIYFEFIESTGDGIITKAEQFLIFFNILGIYICYTKTLTYDYRRGVIWYQLLTLNHRIEYFSILTIFLGVSFFMPEQLIESTFKLCLIGIVLFAFRKIKNKGVHKDLDAEFLDKVSNLYFIYFFITVVTYFNLQDILTNGIDAITEIYEKKHRYYNVPLLLGILCVRYKFYLRLKIVIAHTTFTDFDRELTNPEIFQYQPPLVAVRNDSHMINFFINNVVLITDISHVTIFKKDYSFKKTFLTSMMEESSAIRDKMQQFQLKNLKLSEDEKELDELNKKEEEEEEEDNEKEEANNKLINTLKNKKVFTFFKAVYMKTFIYIFENFEFFFRIILQIICTIYIFQKTNIIYPSESKTFQRTVNFPIIMVITFWNLFTCKVYDHYYLKNLSIFVVIPTLFLAEGLKVYFYFVNKKTTKSSFEKLEDIMISLFTIHTFLLIYSTKSNKIKNVFMMKLELMAKRFKHDLKVRNKKFEAFSLVLKTFIKGYGHYAICSFGIGSAMFEASLFDIILIILSLNFILKRRLNRMKWFKYILYIDFLILSK